MKELNSVTVHLFRLRILFLSLMKLYSLVLYSSAIASDPSNSFITFLAVRNQQNMQMVMNRMRTHTNRVHFYCIWYYTEALQVSVC